MAAVPHTDDVIRQLIVDGNIALFNQDLLTAKSILRCLKILFRTKKKAWQNELEAYRLESSIYFAQNNINAAIRVLNRFLMIHGNRLSENKLFPIKSELYYYYLLKGDMKRAHKTLAEVRRCKLTSDDVFYLCKLYVKHGERRDAEMAKELCRHLVQFVDVKDDYYSSIRQFCDNYE